MPHEVKKVDMRQKKWRDLLQQVKDRYKVMESADHDNRHEAMEDLKFTNEPGHQWDYNMKQERGQRPCYEFNKIRPICKRVINEMRANRPQAKVRPVEGGDKEIAEIYEGLVRNIWNISDADTVVDYAGEYQVAAGMGAWRVSTTYVSDSMFEQDIKIEAIPNPFTLYCDPAAKDILKRDAEDWVLTEKITKKAFEQKYGEKGQVSFENDSEYDDDSDWEDDDRVRIAEYWYKEPHTKELWQLRDGAVVDSESDEANGIPKEMIVKRREVYVNKIFQVICSGDRILEGPNEWPGTMFPFVMVHGEFVYIDGQPKWWGLTRFAKDAQRDYNVARTSISEQIAQAPKTFFWATAEQAGGNTDRWAEAHKKNFPFLLYNPDPQAPGTPQQMQPAPVPAALMTQVQLASDELKAITGIFDASMGARSNESSGRAIYARQQQGEIVTFNYQDNMAKASQHTYALLMDLIPSIYDTERELRVLGSDGADDYVKVNQIVFDPESGRAVRVNDLSAGKYDVTVTVGPSFATLRQEAAETWSNIGNQYPELWAVAGDLIMKSMDLPYSDDIAERLQTLLPPQIQQQLSEGKDIPPEVQQMMAQAEQAMQQVQEHGQLVQAAAQELEQQKAASEKDKADIRAQIADLKAAESEFKAEIAEKLASITQKEAALTMKAAELKEKATSLSTEEFQAFMEQQGSIEQIDDILAQFMQVVDQAMSSLDDKAETLRKRTERKVKGGTTRRENGELVAEVEYDDGERRTVRARRVNGELQLVPEGELSQGPDSEAPMSEA